MSEKKQVAGTARLIGAFAFVILTAAIYLLLFDSPLWASPPGPNVTGDPAITSVAAQGEGESPLDLRNVQLAGTFENSQVASDENASWVIETVDSGGGYFSSLVVDRDGYPHISYGGLKYAHRDASGWHIQAVDSGTSTSLVLDGRGYPHVSYHHSGLKYAYHDASGWHMETVDSERRAGYFSSLALDASGYPHISYYEEPGLADRRHLPE